MSRPIIMITQGSQPKPFNVFILFTFFIVIFSIISRVKAQNDNFETTTSITNYDTDDGKGNEIKFIFYFI